MKHTVNSYLWFRSDKGNRYIYLRGLGRTIAIVTKPHLNKTGIRFNFFSISTKVDIMYVSIFVIVIDVHYSAWCHVDPTPSASMKVKVS